MRHQVFGAILTAAALINVGCEAHDYIMLGKELTVDSSQEIFEDSNDAPIQQDLFVRYQLDYELTNTSGQAADVVAAATSFVNKIPRVTGQKVWHLNPGETVQGILTSAQLELGNSLSVSLQCCAKSLCDSRDVICPDSESAASKNINDVAAFCYTSCENIASCLDACPAEEACASECSQLEGDIDKCRAEHCGYKGSSPSCTALCSADESCLAQCQPSAECSTQCQSYRASCYNNCLSTWNRCTGEVYDPPTEARIPCELCGGTGECEADIKSLSVDGFFIKSAESGETIACDPNCQAFPSACVTGCETLYSDSSNRLACETMCLRQHLYWCNDNTLPYDYIDSNWKQPCCFDAFCQNTLTGIVKTYDVECFNDTSCGSGKTCASEGICVSDAGASCTAAPYRRSHALPVIAAFSLCFLLYRRNRTRRMPHRNTRHV